MDVKFYLKRPKEKGKTAIYCLCHFGYKELTTNGNEKFKPVKIYTKLKIYPKFWDAKRNRAKETSKFPEHPEFNDSLIQISSSLNALFLELQKRNPVVTPELFKSEWERLTKPQPLKAKPTLIDFAEQFIINVASTRKENTLKNYRNSLKHVKEYAESRNISLSFENITLDFHLDFVEYLKNEKSFKPNTIWRIVKVVKMFMNEAAERKLHKNFDYKSKRFAVSPEQTDVIYLNNADLEKLYSFDLSKNKKLERVRDLFLIGCYTGLRFSDFSKLTPDNIIEFEGVKMLNVRTQKTNQPVSIPLHSVVVEIINRYDGNIPKALSNQKFNDYLKDVAREAGITESVTIEQTKGNLTTPKTFKKCDLVTTHTGRRTFATNAYLAGIDPISIRAITGHKTEKAFLAYIRLSGKENALILSKHPYFNKPILKVAK